MATTKKTTEQAVESTAKKAAPVKTTAAKKTAAKTTKAVSTAVNVYIQANDGETTAAAIVEKAKAVAGVDSAKKIDVYVKPEENKVYYVIDDDTKGDFPLV
jgi:cell division protein FtsX